MELRVLHAAARGHTWYGQWQYGFGRGAFNMNPRQASRSCGHCHASSFPVPHACGALSPACCLPLPLY